ncbi:tricorn protease [Luteitalea sp. TBR-22]|uniref:S41 family peptidase n=1 Tax=Luteitalea sp. TBR-22 TaxID=2802971 RepID=UPI001AF4F927|nr:S41 family peptidase [Luteitalea sp. TBR-22]BCS34932.1 tricorn protease [Luteitalea sp. TBR-22]
MTHVYRTFRAALTGGVLLAALSTCSAPAHAQTRLLRFPAIHGDRVAFTYAGDLWVAPVAGGTATRLTAHPGMEVFARFSPDGKWIAFTGQYDGDEQVYVVPSTGGEPRQLTYYPARGPLTPRWGWDNQVYGWTPDGKNILFRSMRDSWTLGLNRLYTVPAAGGPAEPLPMPESGAGDYSPDGTRVVYSPLFRDFRPEKRYGGGMANDLFVFDLKSNDAKRILDHPRADRDPMWIDGTIYFTSDRDGTFNLYAYDVASAKVAPLTTSRTWDVRWPSSDKRQRIVYELNGELQVIDVKTGRSTPIAITVPTDGTWKRPSRVPAAGQIEDFELSPKGERALFVARGDVFTVPIEKGPTRNLTMSSGAHDKWARWSPDGSRIAFISDRSGEDELYAVAQDGSGQPEQLTSNGATMRYQPEWAPDGKRIAFSDRDGKVFVYAFDTRAVTEVADAPRGQVRDYTWSPRGNHLAFSMTGANGVSAVHVWSAGDGQRRQVTDGLFNAENPAWDPDGDYLFYLSDRDYAPFISSVEFNFATNRTTGIFALALRKGVKHPFPPESDEVTLSKLEAAAVTPKAEVAGAGATSAAAPSPMPGAPPSPTLAIDFEGLGSRVARVPLDGDNYVGLTAKKGHLIYVVGAGFYYGRQSERKPSVRLYSLKDRKETTLVDDAQGYALSSDGSKVLVRGPGGYTLHDATPAGANARKPVSTAGLVVDRVPTEEWRQIFHEVWRQYRDWFYVPNMHGFDWVAIRKQYEPWLAHVAHRSDLNYLISEMVSELTVQHAYIEGGDFTMPPRPGVALPGARLALDKASGRYRLAKIFAGQNEEPTYRAPLTEIGVDVKVGDYVLAIDGEALRADEDPYRLLRNKAGRPVELTVNTSASLEGARKVTFNPIASESDLIYLDWVQGNRARVDRLSNGRIGYLHIPDMGAPGLREFIKWYYPQLRKEGLIVDVRANGGGNVSRMLIERLRRTLLGVNYGRVDEEGSPYPDGVFIGPKAAILNENSSSDGDIFPYMFREAGLGPLIGRRSWGGVVGISPRGPLIDGGVVSVPLSGLASAKGAWVIEGYGVDPDIDVENDPKSVIEGKDPQLERAVAEVMKKLQTPVALPKKPAPPVKVERR